MRREINGNFILLGIIGFVQVPQLPITAHKICLFNRWTAGFGTFTRERTFDRSGPDDGDAPERGQIRAARRLAQRHECHGLWPGDFEAEGVYYIEVLVDDVMKLRFPLPIRVAAPPAGTPPANAPGT